MMYEFEERCEVVEGVRDGTLCGARPDIGKGVLDDVDAAGNGSELGDDGIVVEVMPRCVGQRARRMDAGQIVNPAKKIVIDDAASGDLLTSRPMSSLR